MSSIPHYPDDIWTDEVLLDPHPHYPPCATSGRWSGSTCSRCTPCPGTPSLRGGGVLDERCRAAPGIVAAGGVAIRRIGDLLQPRTPHWSKAVERARAAARALLDPDGCPAY